LIWSGGDNYLIFTVPYKTNYRLFNFPCSYKSIKTCLLFQEKLENYSIQVPVWKSVRNPNPVVATFIIDSKSTRRMILKVEPDIQVDRYRHTANSTYNHHTQEKKIDARFYGLFLRGGFFRIFWLGGLISYQLWR
jgi:hypothetical protein